jgi:hypothetical protein
MQKVFSSRSKVNIVTSRHVINAYLPFPLVLHCFCQDAPPPTENVEMADQIAPADAADGQGHGVDDASDNGQGHAGDEVAVNGQEPPTCVICHETLRGAGLEIQTLQCGHPWHRSCLEETWRVGGHEVGWCPFRCDVREAAQAMALETGDDVTGDRQTPSDAAEPEFVL